MVGFRIQRRCPTAAMLLLAWAWSRWLHPGMGVVAEAAVKTLVLGGLMAAGAYLLKISPTVNGYWDKLKKRELKIKKSKI
jgi:hypothetical protein